MAASFTNFHVATMTEIVRQQCHCACAQGCAVQGLLVSLLTTQPNALCDATAPLTVQHAWLVMAEVRCLVAPTPAV
eukprot:scaffold130716_cov17-Tisochrysis_lutea.AAC.2